jgi:hypothetical protein
MTTLSEVRTKDFVVGVHYDTHAESTRDWMESLGTMVCWHKRYGLGDKHTFDEPSDFAEVVKSNENLILPLYLYDHSGITMNTNGFYCEWDSGQVGWYYVSHKDIEKEYGAVNEETIEKARQVLIAEVKLYDEYLQGNVFGFTIERKVYNAETNEVELEHEESCWGFYGDIKDNGILDAISEFDEALGKEVAKELGIAVEVA